YCVVQLDDTGLVVEANPHWSGPRGNVARIEVEFVSYKDHHDAALARWRDDDLDVLLMGAKAADVDEHTVTTVVAGLMTIMLLLNSRQPALESVEVRRAILAAMDTAELAMHSESSLRPAQPAGLIPPAMPGHSRRSGAGHDRDEAARLLAAAGHPEGEGLPRLKLYSHIWVLSIAEVLIRQLAEVGIEVDLHMLDAGLGIYQQPPDADLLLSSWVADYADPDGFFRGLVDGARCFDMDDGQTVHMLREARSVRDHDRRLMAYQDVDRRLVQEMAVLAPIGYPRTTLLTRPWVKNAWASPVTPLRLSDVVIERENSSPV
ncbi:MAG: ABC transporter substrate-binding protein, partial [Gaiellales bacterium]